MTKLCQNLECEWLLPAWFKHQWTVYVPCLWLDSIIWLLCLSKWTVCIMCTCCCCAFHQMNYYFFMKRCNQCLVSFSTFVIFLIITRTLCGPILSVIILVTNKSDFRFTVICFFFCFFFNNLHDYRLNWTLISPITFIIT